MSTTTGTWRRADEPVAEPDEPVEPTNTEPVAEPKAEPVVEPVAEPPVVVNEYWKSVGEKSGYAFESEDHLINELKSKRDLSTKLTDYESKLKTFDELDPLALDIDKAAKAGLDLPTYLEARSMNVEQLEGKKLLEREFLLKNQALVKQDKDFARQKFEREYQKNFGILDKPLDLSEATDEERNAYEEQRRDAEFELKAKSIEAKGFLAKWQSENVSIPEPVQRGMTEEMVRQYYDQAETSVDELETIELAIGDKTFKFGVDEYKESLKEDLRNPVDSLKRFGIDLENGQIDPIAYQELLLAHYAINDPKLFSALTSWHSEQSTASKVTAPPAPPNPNPGGSLDSELSRGAKMAQVVAASRKAAQDADR